MNISNHIQEHIVLGLPIGGSSLYVGLGQKFSTIQSAIDSISDESAWVSETAANSTYPLSCTAWTQNTSNLTVGAFAGIFSVTPDIDKLWFSVSDDTVRKYPVERFDQGTPGLRSLVNRVDADVSGTKTISYFRENPVTIYLTDSTYTENVTINKNISISIVSIGRTTWTASSGNLITLGSSARYGSITFGGGMNFTASNGSQILSASANHRVYNLTFLPGCRLSCAGSDMLQLSYLGRVQFLGTDLDQKGNLPLSHFILATLMNGDLEVKACNIRAGSQSVSTPEIRIFDFVNARTAVFQGLRVQIDDPYNRLTNVEVIGNRGGANSSKGDYYLSDIHVTATSPISSAVQLMNESSDGTAITTGKKVNICGCTIDPANISGTRHLFKTSAGGSNQAVSVSYSGGGTIDTPSLGSLVTNNYP